MLAPDLALGSAAPARGWMKTAWQPSWPLFTAMYVFLLTLYQGHFLDLVLLDGDTYWHLATGQWILQHGAIPMEDPFSHTMRGAPWTSHEWLSQVILARTHEVAGWGGLVALTGLAYAATIALLLRALLEKLEPIRAVLFAVLAVLMVNTHVLARPHMLAMPLMMLWAVSLVRARDADQAPSMLLLPVLVVWANLHGGFTFGLALAGFFAAEAVYDNWQRGQARKAIRDWTPFVLLAIACGLATPHGPQAYLFTWQVLMEDKFALSRISEWASPSFHHFQPLELWLLGGLAMVLHQGLRLPAGRLLLLLGLLHLALKHVRNVELVGLLGPLVIASALAQQWRRGAGEPTSPASGLDRLSARLAHPAGIWSVVIAACAFVTAPMLVQRLRPALPPESAAPVKAIQAARDAGVTHRPVLNQYGWGGYLIYVGIPVGIDGRADMYRDAFLKRYLQAIDLTAPDGLVELLARYDIAWSILPPGTPAIALLDRLPGWRRLYADKTAVVHVRTSP